jgi:hypothetical protein
MAEQEPSNPLLAFTQPDPSTEELTFLGTKFPNIAAVENAVGSWIRQAETEKAQLQGRVTQASAAPAPQQMTTGREPTDYNHQTFLEKFTNNGPDAMEYALKSALFGDAAAKGSVFEMLRQNMLQTQAMGQELAQMKIDKLKGDHPEVDWDNPAVVDQINQVRTQQGFAPNQAGIEGALGILQSRGKMHTRQQWQAQMAAQQSGGGEPQQQFQPQWNRQAPVVPIGPPSVPRQSASPGLDVNAILEKMADPATSVADAKKLGDALAQHEYAMAQQQRRA